MKRERGERERRVNVVLKTLTRYQVQNDFFILRSNSPTDGRHGASWEATGKRDRKRERRINCLKKVECETVGNIQREATTAAEVEQKSKHREESWQRGKNG